MTPKQFIAEVSLILADTSFEDFTKPTYQQAYFRTMQEIAHQYHVNTFLYSFESMDCEEVELNIPGFDTEQRVFVDGKEYQKNDFINDDSIGQFYLRKVNDKVFFNYSEKREHQNVVIYYTVQPNDFDYRYEDINTFAVLPEQLQREHLDKACFFLARIGIAKFQKEKLAKYQRIYKMNQNDKERPQSLPSASWTEIKPFTLI